MSKETGRGGVIHGPKNRVCSETDIVLAQAREEFVFWHAVEQVVHALVYSRPHEATVFADGDNFGDLPRGEVAQTKFRAALNCGQM